MNSAASMREPSGWLVEEGLRELEQLFRAVLSHQSEPILIADNDRHCLYASSGASKLFGLSMGKMVGHRIDDLVEPNKLHYTANNDVLPGRHVWVLNGKSPPTKSASDKSSEKHAPAGPVDPGGGQIPAWTKDYAFLSLDAGGQVAAWYSGAERIYGYKREDIIGKHVSLLYSGDDDLGVDAREELKRTAIEGHLGNERWHR